MSESVFAVQPGAVFAGRYAVQHCLGRGSMGIVYSCLPLAFSGRQVALKVLYPEIVSDKTSLARFRNEIIASYDIHHPHVVKAYEYFREGQTVGYTMEYVGGGDMRKLIENSEKLSVFEIIRLLIQVASGVQAIHENNIVHRDLKPENLLLTAGGDIKITDFGTIRRDHWRQITDSGGVVGTVDYMAPEYLSAGVLDLHSDIFSIGVIAYELLTGRSPFAEVPGGSFVERIANRLTFDPPNPVFLRADVPPALARVIMSTLRRDSKKRLGSAKELVSELTQLLFRSRIGGVGQELARRPSRKEEVAVLSLLNPRHCVRGAARPQFDVQ